MIVWCFLILIEYKDYDKFLLFKFMLFSVWGKDLFAFDVFLNFLIRLSWVFGNG